MLIDPGFLRTTPATLEPPGVPVQVSRYMNNSQEGVGSKK